MLDACLPGILARSRIASRPGAELSGSPRGHGDGVATDGDCGVSLRQRLSPCALLAGASVAPAADVGANDDTGKYAPDAGAAFYAEMAALGLRQTVVTVRWLPSDPLALQDQRLLDLTSPRLGAGLRVVFATYPYPPREIEAGLGAAGGVRRLARRARARYPDVRQFVVGNEPNQPAFWRPQFARRARTPPRPAFGPFLAAGYDALKAVDPAIAVVGVGLSPRGNDRPQAKSNVSTSPVRFLAALGAWYRASGRTRPLMDGFSFHPYPNRATDPLERGYAWPNAGFVNLDRIKQALWDAFAGTAQPTTLDGLRLYLDEVGWQVDTTRLDGLPGARERPGHGRGRRRRRLRRARPPGGLRPGHRAGQRLRLPGRRAADRLPGGAPARRRHAAPGRGGRARRDRGDGVRLRRSCHESWQPGDEVTCAAAERRVSAAGTGRRPCIAAGEEARARCACCASGRAWPRTAPRYRPLRAAPPLLAAAYVGPRHRSPSRFRSPTATDVRAKVDGDARRSVQRRARTTAASSDRHPRRSADSLDIEHVFAIHANTCSPG